MPPIIITVGDQLIQLGSILADYCQCFVIFLTEHPGPAIIGGLFVGFAFFAIHASVKCAQ